jgi:hypothetical protein
MKSKLYKKIVLGFFILINIFIVNVDAEEKIENNQEVVEDSMDDFFDYMVTQASISDVTTTIIPNFIAVESDNSIKIVSHDVLKNLDTTRPFVIGKARAISAEDYDWLCKIVYCEAGGEDEIGQILVANVIFNRFDTGRYGNTLEGVIFAPGQFQPVTTGKIHRITPSQKTINAVNKALDGIDYSQGAMYFMSRTLSDPNNVKWFDSSLKFLFKHGCHEFFK